MVQFNPQDENFIEKNNIVHKVKLVAFCLCWGFTAQSTQWGHVERCQFTKPQVYLLDIYIFFLFFFFFFFTWETTFVTS